MTLSEMLDLIAERDLEADKREIAASLVEDMQDGADYGIMRGFFQAHKDASDGDVLYALLPVQPPHGVRLKAARATGSRWIGEPLARWLAGDGWGVAAEAVREHEPDWADEMLDYWRDGVRATQVMREDAAADYNADRGVDMGGET